MLVQETNNKLTTLRKSTVTSAPSSSYSSSSSLNRATSPDVKMSQELAKHDTMPNNSGNDMRNQPIGDHQQRVSQTDLNYDSEGLILPKRVIHPAGAQPIIKDLNRELKFNQTMGRSVLDQKSELKKALEKREDNKKKKQIEQDRLKRRTSLELRLEERAERLAREIGEVQSTNEVQSNSSKLKHLNAIVTSSSPENGQQASSISPRNEFLEIHAKLCQNLSDINQKVNDKSRFINSSNKQNDSQIGIPKPSSVTATLPKIGFSVADQKKVPGRSTTVN